MKPKRIEDHTDAELDQAINEASATFPLFYKVLHGIDAYMERRERRKTTHRVARDTAIYNEVMNEETAWGDS